MKVAMAPELHGNARETPVLCSHFSMRRVTVLVPAQVLYARELLALATRVSLIELGMDTPPARESMCWLLNSPFSPPYFLAFVGLDMTRARFKLNAR